MKCPLYFYYLDVEIRNEIKVCIVFKISFMYGEKLEA